VTSYAGQAVTLPAALLKNPYLGRWLSLRPSGIVEVRSGKVELGQGVLTALAQIVADELDVDVERVRMTPTATDVSPDEGYTAGSLSIQHSGAALRLVCAEARALYLAVAGERLSVAVADLSIDDGVICAPDGATTSYWELADDTLLDRRITGDHPAKRPSQYRIVGTNVGRLDLPDKVTGTPRFIHDLSLDGMCFGRVVRPPSRGATLSALDRDTALAMPGVITVVRDGDFLGVVAEREEVAIRAAEQLRRDAGWDQVATLPDEDELIPFLTEAPADTTVVFDDGDGSATGAAVRSKTAIYHRPYLAHASMGTSCATAMFAGERSLQVWTHSQGVFALRDELARTLDLGVDDITVTHVEGAGCYGHNGADDVALDAVLLAAAVPGRPVQVVWSRPDELGWAPFGPAGVVRIVADLDSAGRVLSWRHDVWGCGHVSRPGLNTGPALLAATHRPGGGTIGTGPEPPLSHGAAGGRNAVPGYDFPHRRAVDHRVIDGPLRTSALRSLGAFLNVFAAESFVDELAYDAGRDPLDYRLACLTDPRGRAVLETAARLSGWSSWIGGDSVGHGIGYARYKNTSAYCAVVAEVEAVNEIRVRKLTIAVDAGLVINPDGVINQVEGGAVQATSWALKERVRFDRLGVTSDTWETYPILRFSEVPAVEVELLADGGNESLGVGETAQGPTVAAIGNAVFDALGVRVRTLPLTAEQIVAAIERDADG
jgi:nicotinate dehydrogenase subunit B